MININILKKYFQNAYLATKARQFKRGALTVEAYLGFVSHENMFRNRNEFDEDDEVAAENVGGGRNGEEELENGVEHRARVQGEEVGEWRGKCGSCEWWRRSESI